MSRSVAVIPLVTFAGLGAACTDMDKQQTPPSDPRVEVFQSNVTRPPVNASQGQQISVDVRIASVTTVGDTTRVSYVVRNLPDSKEPLWKYVVAAPAGILRIPLPAPPPRLRTDGGGDGPTRARWIMLRDFLPPDSMSQPLVLESIGLPGIVDFWAGGYFPPPKGDDEPEPDTLELPDPFVTQMITGKTVGIEPWPSDRSSGVLLGRLRSLTQSTCSDPLLWIASSGICTTLLTDLDRAAAGLSNAQIDRARDDLRAYINRLSAQSGDTTLSGITSAGYWLLKANADILIGRL